MESISGVKPGDFDTKKMPKGLELQDEATVLLDRASGVPLRIEHKRHVALGTSITDTRWTLEKLPDGAK